jgi:hypothetical protein
MADHQPVERAKPDEAAKVRFSGNFDGRTAGPKEEWH